jgi:hypothetical protein
VNAHRRALAVEEPLYGGRAGCVADEQAMAVQRPEVADHDTSVTVSSQAPVVPLHDVDGLYAGQSLELDIARRSERPAPASSARSRNAPEVSTSAPCARSVVRLASVTSTPKKSAPSRTGAPACKPMRTRTGSAIVDWRPALGAEFKPTSLRCDESYCAAAAIAALASTARVSSIERHLGENPPGIVVAFDGTLLDLDGLSARIGRGFPQPLRRGGLWFG